MAVSLNDLFPMLRSNKGSAGEHAAMNRGPWGRAKRKQPASRRAAAPRASAISFETIEPRVLLSADTVVGGITDSLANGLGTVGTEIGELIEDDPLFKNLVPGIVTTLEIGDNVYQVSPTLGDALEIKTDVHDGTYAPVYDFDPAGKSLADRYAYVNNSSSLQTIANLWGDAARDEAALKALDIDQNGGVSIDEAFSVFLAGRMQSYLGSTTIVDQAGTPVGVDALDVAIQVREAILTFDDAFVLGGLAPLADRVLLDIDGVTASFKNDTLTWNVEFTIALLQRDSFSLGYEAENLGIALDPADPPEQPNNDPFGFTVARSMSFGSFIFGVKSVSDGVGNDDFFFAVPDKAADPNDGLRVGVNVGTPGSPASLIGLGVNVGFLGATVVNDTNTSADGFVLDMDAIGGASDPSSAAALGFTETQLGALNAGGTVEAENVVSLGSLATNPVVFTLKIGTSATAAETEVTLASGNYADAGAVVAALNAAIAGKGLGGVVTASDADADEKLEFTVVASDPSPLGFAAETGALSVIVGTPTALVGKTAAELAASPDASFLLTWVEAVTGQSISRVISVDVTSFSDDGADDTAGNEDDLTTLEDVRVALQAAVNAAFGGGFVNVTTSGGNLRMAAGANTIEISRKLTVDTLEQITLAELGTGDVFDVEADANASLDVYMLLRADSGLKDADGNDYRPEGTIKVDIDPFDGNDVKEAKIDEDPQPPTTDIIVASFMLTDKDGVALKGGASDLQTMLDFNVVSVADILGTFTQIANWFERVTSTEQLLGFDLPFLETSIGEILNFKDLITDTFLLDDGDDGVKAPNESSSDINDVEKLLKWVTVNGQQQLRSLFSNAQQLEKRLNELLPVEVDARVIVDDDGRQNLVYHLSAAEVGIDVDSQQPGDQPLVVPLDFDLDLGPIGGFVTQGKLTVTAKGEVGFDLGIILGNAVDVLDIDGDDATEVKTLNSDAGVRINTNLALTTLGIIEPLVGRLSGDAVFRVTMLGGANPGTFEVTVPKSATVTNTTLADLITDLNDALQNARPVNGDGTLGAPVDISGQIVAGSEPIQEPTKSVRLVLRAADGDITRFQVQTSTINPAYTELGLQTQSASTVSMVGSKPVSDTSPGVPVELQFVIKKGLASSQATVTLPTTGEFGTNDNFSLQSLVNDLNGVLAAGNTGIVASHAAGRLVLSAVDADITGFTLKGATALGFDVAVANEALDALGVTATPTDGVDDVMVAGAVYRAGAGPQDPFGRLGVNVEFTINGKTVTLTIADTANNADVEDLARSLNAAIEDNDQLKGAVAASVEAGRLALRAIDASVASITVAGLDDPGESEALGFANGSSIAGLHLRTTANGPVSYGVSSDTDFVVTINGTAYDATLQRDNTILNRSLYDLAASINNAINAAVGGANKNPLIATVQGGQIVIGVRTTAAGTGLVGDAYDPGATHSYVVKPSEVTSFSLNSSNATFVDELKLLTATDAEREANKADFVIYFADGTSAEISLDELDPDKNQSVDEIDDGDDLTDDDVTLDQVIAAIYSQVSAQLPGRTTGPGQQFEIRVALNGTSLQLIDRVAGSSLFRVAAVNGAPTAANLGILASDTSNNNINEVSATTGVRDGIIDGARIATIDFADRVWLDNVGASASFEVKTKGDPVTNQVSAEATFGFAGIRAFMEDDQKLFSASIDLPLFNGQKSLAELFDIFTEDGGSGVADLIGDPMLELSGDFSFKVEVLPGLNIAGFDMPENDASVTFKTDAVQIKLSDITSLEPGKLLDKITIEANNFDDLINFDAIKFDNVFDAILAIADFLSQFEAFGFMDDDIPVLGVSVKDLLGVADEFVAAVNEFRDNPAGGIQQLSQKILESLGLPNFANPGERDAYFNNLGIPVPAGLNQLIEFAFDTVNGNKVLRFDLRFPMAFSEALNVDLDLGEILGTDLGPIDIQGGAGLAASGYLDARLSFGIDLDDPTTLLIYDDVTGVFGALNAGANNIQFNAAIGPLGAFVKDGRVNLGLAFNVTGDDGNAGPSTLGDFLDNLQASLTGSAEATLPVYFPSDSQYLGDIVFDAGFTLDGTDGLQADINSFELPDFSNIDFSAIDPFASIPLMLDALDFFLMGLQDTLDGEVFGVQLPLIGNQLQGAVDFIEDTRRELLAPLRQYIEQAPSLAEDVIEALLFELLGDASAQGMVNGQNIEDFLGIGGDIEGLGLLGDLDGIAGITQDDISTISDGNDGWQWIFNIGGAYELDVPLDFDLGIPAIALEMNTALQFSLTWGLTFGVGISKQDGAYIYVGDDSELEVKVAVDVPNQSLLDPAAIRGELGFLQLEVWEDGGAAEGLEGKAEGDLTGSRGTFLQAQFTVDLLEAGATGADADRVSFSELGSLDVEVGLQAEAEVNLFLKAAFNDSIVPDTIAALLPSISGRFILDWETGNVFADDFDFAESLDILGFRDVKVDMGSFISDLLGPFVEKIAEVTGPLQPIIDVITAPIPVVSDLAGQPISLVDIAGMTGYVEPAMIYAIADIISLVNRIGDASSFGEFNIPLGDFILLDRSLGNAGGLLTGGELLKDGYSLAGDTRFDGSTDPGGGALGSFLTSMRDAIGQDPLGDFDSLLNSGSGSGATGDNSKTLVNDLKSGQAGGGFAFPIFDNPSLLFGLLLGKDVPLVTYDLAPFGMDFSYVQKFPIWDALFIRIGGSASLTIDLAFGYDTRGVKDFWAGGFTNPLDLLAGLYVSDTNQPTGEGVDVPELVLKGELFAGAELNLGIASAGAEGVIGLVTNFDLYDPDSDGKVRIDELVGNFLYEFKYGNPALAPVAIFDVYGQIYAQLRAFVEALFFKIDFEITPPITLFEFSIPFERQPFLATERGDGSLLLNIGPNAAQRLNGDTRDIGEEIYVKSLSDTEVLVWGMGIAESDGQKYQIKAGQGIFAYGGDGNDIINLEGVTHDIAYFIEGGAGDDTIVGGQNGGTIKGDSGNDNLQGGGGADVIYGGAGNDTIDAKGGDDTIFGDTGSVTVLDGGITRYRSIVSESDGDDKLYGGDGRDIIIGAGGIDYIEGGAGDDIALGDGGNFDLLNGQLQPLESGRYDVNARGAGAKDTILGNGGNDALFGGAGDDLIDGGADNDEIEAGEGFDVVYGGSGADTIYGGTQNDVIFGFRDPQGSAFSTPGFDQSGDTADVAADGIDTIFGEDGNDYIRGNAANDVIRGGAGADIIFGDEGDDQIYGEAGGDIMFGGADDDTIDGSDGSDIAFGDDGLVVYIDFEPGKADFNFTGSRIRFLDGSQLIGDGSETLIGDYATRDDGIATSMDLIVTQPLATDGSDTIIGGEGNDIVFGGGGLLDTLFGDFDPTVVFSGPRPSGQDVMIGDGGRVELSGRRMARIAAESNALDGIDHLSGNDGGDYMFGGGASDVMHGFSDPALDDLSLPGVQPYEPLPDVADNDVMLGDNGEILLDSSEAKNRIKIIRTTYVAGDSGRSDQMFGTWGNDVMFGGLNGSMDVIEGGVGEDILLGDQGAIYFVDDATTVEVEGDSDLDTLDLIRSFRDGLGGEDEVSGGEGADVLIGGTAGDIMYGDNATASGGANDGDDIMLGDNADVWLIGTSGRLLVQVAAMPAPTAVDLITTTDDSDAYGGADTLSGNAGNDVMLGGVNNGGTDKLYGDRASPNATTIANDGDDIMLGDNGLLDFTFGADTDRVTLDLIRSFEDGLGGIDELSGGKGQDVGVGGTAGDTIFGDDANYSAGAADVGDILLGDNADIFLVDATGAAGADLKTVLGSAIDYLLTTDEANPQYGGVDRISGNAGGDVIAGGVQGDYLWGDRETPVPATSALDGNDIMLGDNARLEWRSDGRFAEAGLAAFILANNPELHAWFAGGADSDLGTLDLITTAQPLSGGRDRMWGDEGSDLMFGGTDTDVMHGDDGDGDYATDDQANQQANQDVMFGDHGRVYPQFSTQAGILSRNFFAIDMGLADGGQGDVMHGEEGDDVMLGQQGDDRMWGGLDDDDMIGGHNRPGGYDELAAGAIDAQLPAIPGNEIADGMNDLMDGGAGDDAMAGDNAVIWRRGDDQSPRFRALDAETIYTTTETEIIANIGDLTQSDPEDAVGRDIELLDHSDTTADGLYGQDVMAGGADDDVMFGQLGDDLMQGDGSIGSDDVDAPYIARQIDVTDSGSNPDTDETLYFNIPESAGTDGDDYMEGNGGRDLMYGGLGQDDMIGGSSALFGLTTEAMRPDDSDTMFGGAGIDTGRNDLGDATADANNVITPKPEGGNGLDADYMMGDNANVYRLVKGDASDAFLSYNYDAGYAIRIIPRAMQQLDYTLGGADYHEGVYTADGQAQLTGQPADNGAADLIHGESGDDVIFGMTGSDVLFGDGQDDDIVGGYGHDWMSGGTGQDGLLGDDGLVLTSRNSTAGEPLNGIAGLLAKDPDTRYSNGNVLDEVISTPGSIQTAVINKSGELKKTIDLVPFSYDSGWVGIDDEYPDNMGGSPFADDIIFGGLGSDWLHGGSGDDAISGAEALEHAYVPVYDGSGVAIDVYDLGYAVVGIESALIDNPTHTNPGNVLAFNAEDTDGQHLNNRFRAGEFRLYDEYDPRRVILLTATGELSKDGTGVQFLLNFNEDEGVIRPAGTIPKSTGQSASSYPQVNDDGDDKIFGDLGNDWLVGGTGRDNVYGGWGNDLLNVDDDHTTIGGLNDQPDTHPTYEDRAYGGAGRDVLIGNTGGDRLIDWVGEYNSYLVPYAPFGQASVSRTLQPFLPEFLYALSAGDGADTTRGSYTGDPRNGEPKGELGLVLQKDQAWQDQTGAPADPQAGNIPGGKRDVLRSADFSGNQAQGFVAEAGTWTVKNGRYEVAPLYSSGTSDAISLFNTDAVLPSYFEIAATINAVKPTAGFKANAYVIFDYVSPTNFKFAGINVSTNKFEIGQRTAAGWQVLTSLNVLVKQDIDHNLLVAVNGNTVTAVLNGKQSLSYAFQPRQDADGFTYLIRDGMIGLGGDNSRARIDNVRVQVIPPAITYSASDAFDGAASTLLNAALGNWALQGGRYVATPAAGAPFALAGNDIAVGANAFLQLNTVVQTAAAGGIVFDMYSPTDFKWAAVSVATQQVLIGHYTAKGGWVVDAAVSRSLSAGTDYALSVSLKGTTASVTLNGQAVLSKVFNSTVVDGAVGTFARGGSASFDSFGFATDDARFAAAASSSTSSSTSTSTKTGATSTSKLSFDRGTSDVGTQKGWRIDWTATTQKTQGKRASGEGVAKGRTEAWHGDFVLNMGERQAQRANHGLRVTL